MKVIELETVDSTNIYAKSHIGDLCNGAVVHALRQTQGRGRLNRKWVDLGENNLFFSIVLKPSKDFKPVYANLTQYACLCLAKVFENYGVNAQIKWPNDIMIDGLRKISGILSETVIEGGELKGIVLGIGINLNAEQKAVDAVPDRVVTALNLEIGHGVNSDAFLDEFLTEFFANYEKFLAQGFEYIKKDYTNKNCFLDKELNVQVLNEIKSGIATGITDDGALILNKKTVLTIGDIL